MLHRVATWRLAPDGDLTRWLNVVIASYKKQTRQLLVISHREISSPKDAPHGLPQGCLDRPVGEIDIEHQHLQYVPAVIRLNTNTLMVIGCPTIIIALMFMMTAMMRMIRTVMMLMISTPAMKVCPMNGSSMHGFLPTWTMLPCVAIAL